MSIRCDVTQVAMHRTRPRGGPVLGSLKMWTHRVQEIQELGPGFGARRISELLRRPLHRCTLRGIGPVVLRCGSSDADVFMQVFRDRQLDLDVFPQGERVAEHYRRAVSAGRQPVVLDLGANNGASALWFSHHFPAAKIVAVEPDPHSAEICRQNTQGREVTVIEAAIGSTSGTVTLVDRGFGPWAVATERDSAGDVPVVTVPDLLAGAGENTEPFIVKVDIEGFESDLFGDNTEWLDTVFVMFIEPHDWMLPDQRTSDSFQQAMAGRGFEMLISGENLIYVRKTSR